MANEKFVFSINGKDYALEVEDDGIVEYLNDAIDEEVFTFFENMRVEVGVPPNEEISSISFGERLLARQIILSPNEEEVEASKQEFNWSPQLTKLLIMKRLEVDEAFQRPKTKKIKLWAKIANDMSAVCGQNISPTMCDNKWRNLLATYKRNKDKEQTTGESAITWEYFKIFNDAFGSKASVAPPASHIGATFMEEQPSGSASLPSRVERPSPLPSVSREDATSSPEWGASRPKRRRRNEAASVAAVITEWSKIEQKRDEEQAKREEERFQALLAVEQKKIEALNNLTDAIKSLSNAANK